MAKAAIAKGYSVHVFALADSVLGTTKSALDARGEQRESADRLYALLQMHGSGEPRLTLDLCTACYKVRGLGAEDAMGGATLTGMHKAVAMIENCDRVLALVP